MKYAFAAVALAAIARAQTLGDIPTCAIPCIDKAVKSESDCSTTDFACICEEATFSAIQGAATSCVIEECGADVALNEVLPATEALCENQGTEPEPTTKAEPTEAPTTSEAAEPTTESSAVEVTTTVETTVAPTVAPVPTNGTIPTTTTSVTVPTGAAAQVGSVGIAAMLGLAAFAL